MIQRYIFGPFNFCSCFFLQVFAALLLLCYNCCCCFFSCFRSCCYLLLPLVLSVSAGAHAFAHMFAPAPAAGTTTLFSSPLRCSRLPIVAIGQTPPRVPVGGRRRGLPALLRLGEVVDPNVSVWRSLGLHEGDVWGQPVHSEVSRGTMAQQVLGSVSQRCYCFVSAVPRPSSKHFACCLDVAWRDFTVAEDQSLTGRNSPLKYLSLAKQEQAGT